jgi:quinol monooxygenase YgiN
MPATDTLKGHITLKGYIDVPLDKLAKVQAALPSHKKQTRAEPGCLRFDVTPCHKTAGRFIVMEHFVDRASFDAHQKRADASRWAEITKDIERDYQISEHK